MNFKIVCTGILVLATAFVNAKEEIWRKSVLEYEVVIDSAIKTISPNQVLLEVEIEPGNDLYYQDTSQQMPSVAGMTLSKQDRNQTPELMWTFDSTGKTRLFIEPQQKYLQLHDPRLINYDNDGLPVDQEDIPRGYYSVHTGLLDLKGGHYVKIIFRPGIGFPVISDKPIIYLYPEKEQEVEVKIFPKGELEFTYPVYKDSWKYTVTPEGILKDGAKNYYYLFWEGKHTNNMLTASDRKTGFVIKGSKTQEFFEEVLPKMGLTPTEYNEFIVYWTPLMQNNPYNFIHFMFNDEYDERVAGIEVSPKPDNMFRLFMVYKPMYAFEKVVPQTLEKANRKGFTLIEWGGTEYKEPEN